MIDTTLSLRLWQQGKVLKQIEGSPITLCSDGVIRFVGDMDIDSDGGANVDHDPCWAPDTTLHHNGMSIDAQKVPYLVCPIGILELVEPVGLGCQCYAVHLRTNREAGGVLADLGPSRKDGECSAALARRIGVNPNSVNGGESRKVILYEFHIGVPAVVDGVTYHLQRLHS